MGFSGHAGEDLVVKELGTAFFGRNMIMALVLAVMIALALVATAQAQTPSDDHVRLADGF